MSDTVTAAEVRDAIAAVVPEAPVIVEQTGGNVATIYVGTKDRRYDYVYDPDEPRYWLAVGPGSYNWDEPWASRFYFSDLSIGLDDDGVAPSEFPVSLDELADAVRTFAKYAEWETAEAAEVAAP